MTSNAVDLEALPSSVGTFICVVCHQAHWSEVAPDDHRFQLFRCRECGCYRIDLKRPPSIELYDRYHSDDSAQRLSGIFHPLWRMIRRQRAKRILRSAPANSRVCDVGCERGELLAVLKQAGWAVEGTQLSRPAAEFARRHFGINVYVGELADAPFARDTFDVILMIHVLEHLPSPEAYLAQVRRMLRPGGVFWVEVPNAGSLTARLCGKRWLHHDPEHHYWNFTKRGLLCLLGRQGFAIERMHHYSWEHAPIGCVQSWLNFLPGPRNVVFGIIREGLSKQPRVLAVQLLHAALAALLLPAACIVSTLESFCGEGQIILVRARRDAGNEPRPT